MLMSRVVLEALRDNPSSGHEGVQGDKTAMSKFTIFLKEKMDFVTCSLSLNIPFLTKILQFKCSWRDHVILGDSAYFR